MRVLRAWVMRLRGLLSRERSEQDFSNQIRADIELHIEDSIRSGMSPDEARRKALLAFGSVDATTEAWRDRRGVPFVETLFRDVTYAFRVLGRNKAWAAVAIFSLALGVGANTAIFSAANTLLLRKLPVAAADELVTLRWQGENSAMTNFQDYGFVTGGALAGFLKGEFSLEDLSAGVTGAYGTFKRLSDANTTLSRMFALGNGPTVNLIVDGKGDTASSQFVSGQYFSTLGVPPAAGRLLLPMDDSKEAAPAGVISHGYWKRRFAEDPTIVGKQVRINSSAFTIVGVAGAEMPNVMNGAQEQPPDLTLPLASELVFQPGESKLDQPTTWWLVMMGRLKPGVTLAQAEANLGPVYDLAGREAAMKLLSSLPPGDQQDARRDNFGEKIPRLQIVSGARGAYDPMPFFRTPLLILEILVGIVLLVVCANLTNLSLAMTTHREREIAVRRAIGSSRRRLIRQSLTEHLVVAMIAGGASLLIAYFLQDLVRIYFAVDFDWAVVGFAFAVSALAGILIGILPALRGSRIQEGIPATGGSARRSHLSDLLLVGQVVLSVALLIGTGLFLRTLINLQHVDPGFDTNDLVLFSIDPGFSKYDDTRTQALYTDLLTNLRTLPGVASVTFSNQALLSGAWNSNTIYAEGTTNDHMASPLIVQEDFFSTMKITLLKGRTFDQRDTATSQTVAVINDALAHDLFGDENPVGRRFGWNENANSSIEVIGVVVNTHHRNLRATATPLFFLPHLQSGPTSPVQNGISVQEGTHEIGARTFEIRTNLPPESLMPSVRAVVQKQDPALPILSLSTQDSAIENQWMRERILAVASSALGSLTLTVSMIGLFGLMSYSVARRTKEIAIRMALGAERRGVLQSVMRDALLLVGIGVAIGLGLALATTRFLQSFLFGLSPTDPAVLAGSIVVMLGVATVAGFLPARRAAKIDPLEALRQE